MDRLAALHSDDRFAPWIERYGAPSVELMITRAEDGSEQGWAVCGTRQTCAVADHDRASEADGQARFESKDSSGEKTSEIKEIVVPSGPETAWA